MSEQKSGIDKTGWDALIILDAGRYDGFADMYEIHDTLASGDLYRVENGEFGFTANWMEYHFNGDYDAKFFAGGQPIYSMEGGMNWDERKHFDVPAHYTDYEWDSSVGTCWPADVNAVVQEFAEPDDQIVVRYLAPHPPFPELPRLTLGRGNRARRVAEAVRGGEITLEDFAEAYADHYATALDAASRLAEWTDGTVVVTADHGECLGDCGQWFHGQVGDGGFDPHRHLVTVPWLVVE